MSLFQNSVLNKYLKGLESEKVNEAYVRFTSHFHNPTIQENIRNSKEEQYQGEFLIDLFVNVLGYIKNPTPDFNLTTELKNIKGSKKTDGAILKGEKALAVIELKGTNTTDLSKVETQAFGYKNNQPGCNYVITSNFEKLRFYIDNAVDFEEFNLFQLTKERFDVLWLCLSSDYLLKDTPKKIKDESLSQEENVTKKLYKDYASFRNEIFDAIQKENPEYDKLTLFKKTQKLLDRFLFIFFAEDRLLLPPNSISSIVNQWTELRDKYDEYFPLYDRFKKYFGYMNTGRKGQQHDIFAYNGGLFAPDVLLDNIKINDDLLYKHTVNLSNYDFESEVSVNILGHIFEHSLNDIDEIQAEIQGVVPDQSKTKRKKDGVFYTPKYITKYIVDNTVGKLCKEKKTELDIQEADYEKERKGRQKTTLKKLTKKLEDYRNWLLQITICDPACGSGAFLNQALEFLIAEHQYIDELQAKLFGDAMVLSEVENAILENNIYGVDINEESVEIAKLSLWLRTAQKGRKLTSLNNNIKCGNSLIDDTTVAGDKTFNWQNEFPEVFAKGGFDVIIGNPPYVQLQQIKEQSLLLKVIGYDTYESMGDLYCLFYEKGNQILKQNGLLGYITSNKWMRANYGKSLRKYLIENTSPYSIIDLGSGIFDSATVDSNILLLKKKKTQSHVFSAIDLNQEKDFRDFSVYEEMTVSVSYEKDEIWTIESTIEKSINQKIKEKGTQLKNWDIIINYGVKTGFNEAFIIPKTKRDELIAKDSKSNNVLKPILRGRDIQRYYPEFANLWLIGTFPSLNLNIDEYSAIKNYLESFGKKLNQTGEYYISLEGKREKSRKKTKNKWFETQDTIAYHNHFNKAKIIYPNMTKFLPFIYDEGENYFINDKAFILSGEKLKYLNAYLNSTLAKYQIKKITAELQGGTRELRKVYMETLYVARNISNEKDFKIRADRMLWLYKELNVMKKNLLNLLSSKYQIGKFSIKLQNWYNLDFGEFLKEFEKANKKSAKENEKEYIKLSLSEEAEWMQYFNEQKQKAGELKTEIDKTDKEIDLMVYELYGLTEEEIKIVEEATA